MAAATTLLHEVYAFLLAARWHVRSLTAAAATLLDEVYAFRSAASLWARSRPYWTTSTPFFVLLGARAELELDCC